MSVNNILLSELKATLARVTIIKNNISDEVTNQLSKDVESYLTPLVQDVEQALKTLNDSPTKK
jgi:hypothetical protein